MSPSAVPMVPSPDPDPSLDARRAVADAARRAIRAIRVTRADAERLEHATSCLHEAAELLESSVDPGPHCQTGQGVDDELSEITSAAALFPHSPVVGPWNPLAPPVEVHIDGEGIVHGTCVLGEPYNGPPWNLTHGGVIAEIFDELLGIATIVGAGGGFTGRLTVHYRKPTPILEELTLRAWLAERRGRKLIARGEIRHDGVVTAEADGLFVQLGRHLNDPEEPGGRERATPPQ